jgi:pyridoxal biosynthesis lyase PdxS
MRVPFDSIFTLVEGRVVPHIHIAIGNVATAAGTPLSLTLVISGVQLGNLIDCDLAVEPADGVMEISGFYKPGELLVSMQESSGTSFPSSHAKERVAD